MAAALVRATIITDTIPGWAVSVPSGRLGVTPAALAAGYALGVLGGTGAMVASASPESDRAVRARSVQYSDFYYTRLDIHRVASYTMLPLFAIEYLAGEKLLTRGKAAPLWAERAHKPVAIALGGLFAVNTVTGVWNLWDARKDRAGRRRRTVHSVLMLVADAGFVWAAHLAPAPAVIEARVQRGETGWTPHKRVAVASMGLATASYLMMLLWKE